MGLLKLQATGILSQLPMLSGLTLSLRYFARCSVRHTIFTAQQSSILDYISIDIIIPEYSSFEVLPFSQ